MEFSDISFLYRQDLESGQSLFLRSTTLSILADQVGMMLISAILCHFS
jgi:hypothetical protein